MGFKNINPIGGTHFKDAVRQVFDWLYPIDASNMSQMGDTVVLNFSYDDYIFQRSGDSVLARSPRGWSRTYQRGEFNKAAEELING